MGGSTSTGSIMRTGVVWEAEAARGSSGQGNGDKEKELGPLIISVSPVQAVYYKPRTLVVRDIRELTNSARDPDD
jgi:hypothetical protein